MGLWNDFIDFISKGNVVDLGVAVVFGVAFNAVVTALVTDIITPLVGVMGHINFSLYTVTINGSTFLVGSFVNSIINFLTIAIVVFLFLVKPASRFSKKRQDTKECPYCASQIPAKATRCPNCTSKLKKKS